MSITSAYGQGTMEEMESKYPSPEDGDDCPVEDGELKGFNGYAIDCVGTDGDGCVSHDCD